MTTKKNVLWAKIYAKRAKAMLWMLMMFLLQILRLLGFAIIWPIYYYLNAVRGTDSWKSKPWLLKGLIYLHCCFWAF